MYLMTGLVQSIPNESDNVINRSRFAPKLNMNFFIRLYTLVFKYVSLEKYTRS